MKINKVLNFDMDGTLADTYSVENWLAKIRVYDPSPYAEAEPMLHLNQVARQLNRLQKQGYKLRIISWCSKESTPEFDELTRQAKLDWLAQHMPSVHWDEVVISEYGVNKSTVGKRRGGILFDDNETVRKDWTGIAFTEKDIMRVLKALGRQKESLDSFSLFRRIASKQEKIYLAY